MGVVTGGVVGTAFHGGTINNTLTVDPPSGSEGVVVAGVDGDTTNLLDLSALHTTFTIDSDGSVLYVSDDTPLFDITATGGTESILRVKSSGASQAIWASTAIASGLQVFYSNTEVFAARSNAATSRGYLLRHPDNPATATLSSGTGAVIDANSDRETYTPVTFNPTAGAAATCAVAVGYPPTPTYVGLWTETEPAGVALDGTIHGLRVYVPGGWSLRLTVANATIGTTTYY